MSADNELEMTFPQAFAVKAMGANEDSFRDHVVALVLAHTRHEAPLRLETRISRNAKFLSVTVEIEAESRAQLDAIYQSLSDDERVVMSL